MTTTNYRTAARTLAEKKKQQKAKPSPTAATTTNGKTIPAEPKKKTFPSEPKQLANPVGVDPTAPKKQDVYYCPLQKTFYARNKQGDYQPFERSDLKAALKEEGFRPWLIHATSLNYLEAEILRIVREDNVRFAGPISGYQPGLYEMYVQRILVTSGPRFLIPKAGNWDNMKRLITGLLGNQAKYFFAWIKCAVRSLRAGPPWAPGQLLAIAGPGRCGKSVLQDMITPLLGGRVSSPYDYMIADTNFNADVYSAEHGLIGDTNHETDHKSRRKFGAAIKKLVVEKTHKLHDKGKTGFSCTPYVRLSLCLNDNPDAVLVLPSLDSDVKDKIILLHAKEWGVNVEAAKFGNWNAYEAQLRSELPALLHAMHRWEIPESIRSNDYGVQSFHAQTLVDVLTSMSQDQTLLDLIDSYLFTGRVANRFEGTATDLVKALIKEVGNSGGAVSIPPAWKVGTLLTLLSEKNKERIVKHSKGNNIVKYEIFRAKEPPLED